MGVSLMVMVAIIAPRQGLPRQAFGGLARASAWRSGKAFWALLTPVILLGGMFSGLFTPTEAAAVADLYALFLGFVVYRTLRVKDLPAILINTAETTGIVMVLVMVAGALGWCMSISRIPQTLAPAIVAAIHEPLVFLLVSQPDPARRRLLHGDAGRAADPDPDPGAGRASASASIPVQFGLIMIFNLILGTIHPPIGVVLFVMARIADITYEQMSRAILPWLVPLLIVLVAITVWPPLTTVAAACGDGRQVSGRGGNFAPSAGRRLIRRPASHRGRVHLPSCRATWQAGAGRGASTGMIRGDRHGRVHPRLALARDRRLRRRAVILRCDIVQILRGRADAAMADGHHGPGLFAGA